MATKVLVIEDNQADFDLIEANLDGAYQLDHVTDLKSGLDKASSADVVLLDLDLPDSKGKETLQTYFGKHSQSTTIVLTGRNDEKMARQAIQHGARDYLVKGLDPLERLHHQIMLAQELAKAHSPPAFTGPSVRLVQTTEQGHLGAMAKHAASASLDHGVVLLSVTRPPGEIDAAIAASGGVPDRMQYVDATPSPGLSGGAKDRTLIVGSPMQLERMQMRVEVAVRRSGEAPLVLVDSLDALAWHNGAAQAIEFIQVLCARLRSIGAGVHICTKDPGSDLASQVATFMDDEPLRAE